MEVSGYLRAQTGLHPGRDLRYPLVKRLCEPSASVDEAAKGKIIVPARVQTLFTDPTV